MVEERSGEVCRLPLGWPSPIGLESLTDPAGDPRLSSHGALLEERGAHHPSYLEVQHWRCEGHGVDGGLRRAQGLGHLQDLTKWPQTLGTCLRL